MSAERREKLVELVNEYLSCEVTDSSALVLELKDALQLVIDYHQGNVDKAKEMLEYIEGDVQFRGLILILGLSVLSDKNVSII